MLEYKIFCFGGTAAIVANTQLINKVAVDNLYVFDTDSTSIRSSIVKNKYTIGPNLCQGLGSGGDPLIAKRAFEEDSKLFENLTQENNCLYVVLTAMGGGTGSGMSVKICELLKNKDKKFIVIASEPFSFEGKNRNRRANEAISEILSISSQSVIIQNNLFKNFLGNLSVRESFSLADYYIFEIIEELLFESNDIIVSNTTFIKQYDILKDTLLHIKHYIKSSFPISLTSSIIILPDKNKELLKALTLDKDLIYAISPRKFEELIEYIYRISGFETKLTPYSKDNGADLLVWTPPPILGNRFLTIVQAKRYNNSNKVGASDIRDLIGAQMLFNADKAQIITTSNFTKQAKINAIKTKIDLLVFDELNAKINNTINF